MLDRKIYVIVGPTASGKSDYAVQLAKKVNGEVISADSRQVYKGLDIGTGKITEAEMEGIKHHLLDVADPKDQFTVIEYVKLAKLAIEDIFACGKTPIICGGTGFYIQALVDGLVLPNVSANEALRKELSTKTGAELLEMLAKLDPERYETIEKHNNRRLIRAIEIATAIGAVPPLKKAESAYDATFIGLLWMPEELRARIHRRLASRLENGMAKEVQNLHDTGLTWKRLEDFGLEYRYLAYFLQGKITEAEMREQLENEIWHYARRQMTWFKRDKRIEWIENK